MPVVYIHGIWNHPRLSVLKERWDKALFDNDPQKHKLTRMARWSGVRYAEPVSDLEVLAALQAIWQGLTACDVPPALLTEAGRAWQEALRGELGTAPSGRLVRFFLAAFVQDAAAYFFREGERREIQEIFRSELLRQPGPFIVVAHSLGAAIAYDVLHEGLGVEVTLFCTCGSPLGLKPIQNLLTKPLSLPPGMRRWRNFLDPIDPIALGKKVGFEDAEVVNPDRRTWYRAGPHSETGYLRTPEVRQAVGEVSGAG